MVGETRLSGSQATSAHSTLTYQYLFIFAFKVYVQCLILLLNIYQGIRGTPSSKKVLIVGKQLSYCRTILRLFDDLPMLNRTLSYGLGSNEKDLISRLTNLLSNVINTIYYPLEHIAWAGDQGVIAVGMCTLHCLEYYVNKYYLSFFFSI